MKFHQPLFPMSHAAAPANRFDRESCRTRMRLSFSPSQREPDMICPQNIDLDLDPLPLFSTKLEHKLVWILSSSI